MTQREKLNDESLMPYGKHKGTQMADVPAAYLLWCHDNDRCSPTVKAYIDENMDALRQEV